MTLHELSKILKLQEQIKKDTEVLESLREASYPVSPSLSGVPHATGIRDKVGDLAIEIATMEDQIFRIKSEEEREREKIEKYIETISDARIKTLMRLRFIKGLKWEEVAKTMGTHYTKYSVARLVYKYIKS